MDPDFDITLNPREGNSPEAAKSHFLDSLGLGERSLLEEARSMDPELENHEGVVLSSMPDDLGYPGMISEPARGLAVSMSVTRNTTNSPDADISLPQEEEPSPEPDGLPSVADMVEVESVSSPEENGPEEILNLACPDCGGALVLQRRHLGVEGACVWCHTPIVAAASGRDGQVRIFPILGGSPKPQAAEPASPMMEEPTSSTGEIVLETSTIATVEDIAGNETEHPVLSPDFSFLPPSIEQETDSPAETFTGAFSAEKEKEESGFSNHSEPHDIESLYGSGGFVPPPDTANQIPSDAAPLGFGAFLQTPVEDAPPSADFSGAVPWGQPIRPAIAPVKASAAATPILSDDEAPAALPSDFSPGDREALATPLPTWEAAFSSEPAPAFPSPAEMVNDDYATGFGSAFSTGSAPESDKTSSTFSFHATPPADLFGRPSDPLPNAFMNANPELPDVNAKDEIHPTKPGLFGDNGLPGTLPWGTFSSTPTDEAPLPLPVDPLPTTSPEPLFASAPVAAPSLFGELPAPVAKSPAPALKATPPISEPEPSVAVEKPVAPTVTSQPLGSKPKPKVRKGFLVLMVVILGFACGGALASYVLPVDQYVASARAFMESKFAPQPAVPVMPPMTTLPAAPGTPVPPVDFQP